ncbi:MAG: efflux transporter outer membrane subunit [Burkholderiaceae bacterium]|nr:efflux transporter outer membrane subunit [Burkholderiaceae bacterium]
MRPAAVGALAFAALLAGCSLTPHYERPSAPVAGQWPENTGGDSHPAAAAVPQESGAASALAAAADLPWRQFVQDARIQQLVELALQNNRDLRIAIQNIEQARAQYQIRRADQVPGINATASASRSYPSAYNPGHIAENYTVGLGLSTWEIDFFGRVAALKDAALAQFLSSQEARRAAQTSLIAAVSNAWLQLKTDTALLALTERTLATRQQSLALVRLQFESGASSALDMRQAESLTAAAQAARAQQLRLRAQDINLLTLLVGQPVPAELIPAIPPAQEGDEGTGGNNAAAAAPVAPTEPLPAFAQVPAGLPSELLLRRPDIRQAEQQLIAANANIGAARAAFFPRIALTASLGYNSNELSGLVASANKAWSVAPSLALPIFDMGRNSANLQAAKAAREIALAQYEKAIQSAFREVADALAGRATLDDQAAALKAQAEADRDSYRMADLRYRSGVASYLNLLDAQRSLFATEQALAQIQLAQRVNEVQLYKALGGGWSQADEEAAAAAEAAKETTGAQAASQNAS